MKKLDQKVAVVMPAYNAERTLQRTFDEIPPGIADYVILVDDHSHDNTVKLAKKLGLIIKVHDHNQGYGGNQKTCYGTALELGADIVVMLHPDYQYDATKIPALIEPIKKGERDIMLGSRMYTRSTALGGGMPIYKYLSNRVLTLVENVVLGLNLSEYHTGFRAFSRHALETLRFETNSSDFVFDQEVLVQATRLKLSIGEISVNARYFPEASSINLSRSVVYGILTLWTLAKYVLDYTGLVRFPMFRSKLD